MPFINVNGQPIHIVKTGSPQRQMALLIHGWSSSWYAMSPLLELLRTRFRCVAVDLPGFGQSPPFEERATIKKYADTLADLIRQMTDSPAVLVGHSMGGMISITLALHYPELVERMVLICPTITGRLSNFINFFVSPVTIMERFGLGSAVVSTFERAFVGLTDQLMRPASFAERTTIPDQVYTRLRTDARHRGQGRVRAECFFAMRDGDLRNQLRNTDTPALVIWGAEDNTVPISDASIIDDEWADADLRILTRAGHWPHYERPELTNRLIASYLGLPRFTNDLQKSHSEQIETEKIAHFLTHSDVGYGLNYAQRMRLAAQFEQKSYPPHTPISQTAEHGRELYLLMAGSVEVWRNLESEEELFNEANRFSDMQDRYTNEMMKKVAILRPGQITGEMAMLDLQKRSADLVAGEDGAVVLSLDRNRLLALCEDDSILGTRILWNIGRAMSKRLRFILWQLYYAPVQHLEESSWEKEADKPPSQSDNIYGNAADLVGYKIKDEN
jgi:pimeloyl-ACP methyl ester carboxylesterase